MGFQPSVSQSVTATRPSIVVDLVLVPAAAIRRKVAELGGEGALGGVAHKDLHAWFFRDDSCVVYNETLRQAFQIKGAIFQKWLALGGMNWGVPDTDELTTPDGVGRYNSFNGNTASIYWTPQTGANAIWGAIRAKWAAMGWERSVLGYPVTDELGTPDGVGRFNHFANGASIYWTPETGAQVVGGEIRNHWARMGWERSYLGYPTSDEADFPEGGRANTFQNGGIYWWPDTGAIDLRDVIVHYTGLYCFGQTDFDQGAPDWLGSDEPYVIASVSTPQIAATYRSRIYEDVDSGDSRPDLIEIYRGKPYGININTIVMEHDFGEPDKYKEEVQKIVLGVHAAGTVALGLIPVVGPVIAAIAGPALGALMPAIGGAISDLLNLGDDSLGSGTVTLSARQMVLLAARTPNANQYDIGYKAESPLISSQGATYRAYFGIVPA